jgi:hypothetical protein
MKLKIKNRHGVTPNHLLNDNNISLKAKGLFAYIQSKPDGWSFSVEKISLQNKESLGAIKTAVNELESHGYLQRLKYQNEKGHWNIEYVLHESPLFENPLTENPSAENPSAENPTLEIPLTENHANNSKQDISKKELVIIDISKKELDKKFKKPKTLKEKNIEFLKLKWSSELDILLEVFNEKTNSRTKNYESVLENYDYWREIYTPQEIQQAIENIPFDEFWHDKMSFVILFRKQNTGKEKVDYIAHLLNVKKKPKLTNNFVEYFK